jgi:hypothetical protein
MYDGRPYEEQIWTQIQPEFTRAFVTEEDQ